MQYRETHLVATLVKGQLLIVATSGKSQQIFHTIALVTFLFM